MMAGKPSDGALAQLGERLHGMQEVEGSIPLGSSFHVLCFWGVIFAGGPANRDSWRCFRSRAGGHFGGVFLVQRLIPTGF